MGLFKVQESAPAPRGGRVASRFVPDSPLEGVGFELSVPRGEIELSRLCRLTAAAPLLYHISALREPDCLSSGTSVFEHSRGAVRGDRVFACLDPSERSFAKRRRLKAMLAWLLIDNGAGLPDGGGPSHQQIGSPDRATSLMGAKISFPATREAREAHGSRSASVSAVRRTCRPLSLAVGGCSRPTCPRSARCRRGLPTSG